MIVIGLFNDFDNKIGDIHLDMKLEKVDKWVKLDVAMLSQGDVLKACGAQTYTKPLGSDMTPMSVIYFISFSHFVLKLSCSEFDLHLEPLRLRL